MTGADARVDRSTALRWLAYAAITLATLAGLFAMHGLPMTMPTAMPMSSAAESSDAHSSATPMEIGTGDTSSAGRMRAAADQGGSVGAAVVVRSPMAGARGGCDAEHDGCLATLREQPHSPSPAPVTLTSAADPASLASELSRAGLLRRGPPPPRPCLTELCISRT